MAEVVIKEIRDFNLDLIYEIKSLELANLGDEASINEWIIPVVIRYGKLIIAEEKESGEIVGICEIIRGWEDNESGGGTAFIHSFYIDEKFRFSGIGKKLLAGVMEILKNDGISLIELTVSPDNKPALNLYEGFGFTVENLRKDEYGKGMDRYLMRFKLI